MNNDTILFSLTIPCKDMRRAMRDSDTRMAMRIEAHEALDEALDGALDHAFDTPALSTAKELACEFHTTKKDMNEILRDAGWQTKEFGKWTVTDAGFEVGGANVRNGVIRWDYDAVRVLLYSE